jgi:hypothetical protein
MARNGWTYWATYKDDGRAATPRGPKGFIESTASFISSPQTGVGREVCIMKERGGSGAEQTGVCYVGGTRVKQRRKAS